MSIESDRHQHRKKKHFNQTFIRLGIEEEEEEERKNKTYTVEEGKMN